MKLIESETYKNLATAFSAECQARTRYEFIEYGARINGYKAIAEIVDEIAFNEFNHARMFYTKIQNGEQQEIKNIDIKAGFPFKEKWDLTQNLKLAAEDEEAEIKLYPKFAKIAQKEGFNDVADLFNMISKTEMEHRKIFLSLYTQMKEKTLYKKEKETVWKCSHCGYSVKGKEAPKECPVCLEKQGAFYVKIK